MRELATPTVCRPDLLIRSSPASVWMQQRCLDTGGSHQSGNGCQNGGGSPETHGQARTPCATDRPLQTKGHQLMSLNNLTQYVTEINHVGIAVQDLEQAKEFYARALGLQCVHEEVNEEQGVREAMLAVADSGSCIQLLAPLREDSPIGKFLARNGEGIQQMAYTVTDIDAVCEHLRSQDIRVLYDQPKRGTADSRVNFVHPKDAGGVLIELVEPAASSH